MAKTKTSTKSKAGARSAKSASRKPKASASKKTAPHKGETAGAMEVTIDRRRGGRREAEQIALAPSAATPPATLERRKKVNRRRQIDPTTCERDYTEDEVEFMNALDDYKRSSGRMFPTCSEVLEVVRSLGYVRLSASELASYPVAENSAEVVMTVADAESGDASFASLEDWQ